VDKALYSSGLRSGDDARGARDVARIEPGTVRGVDRSGDMDDGIGPDAQIAGG
jgi:hypothetical protein